jgi:hypothetical protein
MPTRGIVRFNLVAAASVGARQVLVDALRQRRTGLRADGAAPPGERGAYQRKVRDLQRAGWRVRYLHHHGLRYVRGLVDVLAALGPTWSNSSTWAQEEMPLSIGRVGLASGYDRTARQVTTFCRAAKNAK